ncbi:MULTISPECIES: thiamine phosphate synthase [unclassified Methylophilus]|uniref:thiamine phosphate synthase n=1 Tax=unclassified Methylophilus TaxID=2630143 RepID=UPI0006FDE8B5|nr:MULTISPECIES: thiamine phosphate synthase [unclassified Methylophilus]KQT41417.1 thiamine-phosphate synthase [Methylophilus sp. Leaf416]KQT57938.1 thiamine-phosphate synthase [Methylophilus sp. Leaf459]
MSYSINGLYLVTPDCNDTELLCRQVKQAIQGGVSIVQYRHKTASDTLRFEQASALLSICRQANIPFLINDHVALAISLDADGVHIGQYDGAIAEAKASLGVDKIIGASCYNRFELAEQAQAAGAGYIAFGACYPSSTKPDAPRATLDLFSQAKRSLSVPVVGIGGITLENAPPLIAAGADALAVITDIFQASDISARCRQYLPLFAKN